MAEHHDEKGHFSPAQSKIAKTMGGKAERAFPTHGTQHTYKSKSGKHLAYSASNMMAAKHNPGMQPRSEKRAKLKTIARGNKDDYRKGYTKGITKVTQRFKKLGIKLHQG